MSTPPTALPAALQAQVDEAERLAQGGHVDAAGRLFQRVLQQVPDHARALSFFAMRAFAEGALDEARRLIEAASAGQPKPALVEANRALILRELGDSDAALEALESALARDPGFVPARFAAGELLLSLGRSREAAEHFDAALARIPTGAQLPPPLRAQAEQAQRYLANRQRELEALMAERLAPLAAAGGDSARFDECLAILFGKQRPKQPKPGLMYFPKLTPYTFFPRHLFDWLERAEAATATVRAELERAMAEGEAGFIPYVQKAAADAAPGSVWNPLNHNRSWGAYFLFNHGKRVERHCAACPQTAALLDSLPLVHIPQRGPTAFFSRLQPKTRIPPHHGATNTRLVAHLPLIVPKGCAIRVGNDVREWKPGEMLIFDDTIEHEAWNDSDETRVVLIFDVWNPLLEPHERALVTAATAALAEFNPGELHNTDF